MLEKIEAFINNHETLFILGTILPFTLFRIGSNIITYNKINGTNYIPLFQNWQKGGMEVNLICSFTFWWLSKEDDSQTIFFSKKVSNLISMISVLIVIISLTLIEVLDLTIGN